MEWYKDSILDPIYLWTAFFSITEIYFNMKISIHFHCWRIVEIQFVQAFISIAMTLDIWLQTDISSVKCSDICSMSIKSHLINGVGYRIDFDKALNCSFVIATFVIHCGCVRKVSLLCDPY